MRSLVLCLLLFVPTAGAEMYRCTTSGGVQFQDRPCADAQQRQPYEPPAITVQSSSGARTWDARKDKPQPGCMELDTEAEIQKAIEAGKQCVGSCRDLLEKDLVLGMIRENFESLCGLPDKINRHGRPGMSREQWVFRVGYGVSYFYFENGVVTSWSD